MSVFLKSVCLGCTQIKTKLVCALKLLRLMKKQTGNIFAELNGVEQGNLFENLCTIQLVAWF